MIEELKETFDDARFRGLVQTKLPRLFKLANIEMTRGERVAMDVGTEREKILIALLIHWFGPQNVDSTASVTKAEEDVRLKGIPISIKTFTNKSIVGFKLNWAVDKKTASDFKDQYIPRCDMILAHINWNGKGGLYYIPLEAQRAVLNDIGQDKYIKSPKEGTNPRGSEIKTDAIRQILTRPEVKVIDISWVPGEIEYDPYKRWVDYWKET